MIALFFDTETTGFRSETFTPEIVQIGAIAQDTENERVVAELNIIVQVDNPIPEGAIKIHGITNDMAATYGVDKGIAGMAFQSLARLADIVVAHNIAFDLDILAHAWPLAYADFVGKQQFCTMRELTEVMKLPKNGNAFHDSQHSRYKAPKLIEAYQYFFHEDFDNAHDAMADVRACRDIYFAMQGTK